MRTIYLGALAVGIFALLASAGDALAQTPASPVLNVLDVQELVISAEPGDNARLSTHFAALADRYTAEARGHTEMAKIFAANANRGAAGASIHCACLAELNTQSAATLRELAAHHERLAAGIASIPPADGARFQGGTGAPVPTDRELNILAVRARRPSEHGALQEYFLTLARKYTTAADRHSAMALAYRGTRIAQAADHCERMMASSRDAAREASAKAAIHRESSDVGE